MALCTDEEVVDTLKAAGLPLPPGIQSVVTRARVKMERAVKEYVGYDVEQATQVDYHPPGLSNTRFDGDETSAGFDMSGGVVVTRSVARLGRRQIVLRHLPVRSVVSVYDNPAAYNSSPADWPATALLPATAYFLDSDDNSGMCWSGILYRNVGYWGYTPRAVKITYVAGLTAAELRDTCPEFKQAAIDATVVEVGKILARARMAIQGFIAGSVSIEDFSVQFARIGDGMLGGPNGTGIGAVTLPTDVQIALRRRVHPASLF